MNETYPWNDDPSIEFARDDQSQPIYRGDRVTAPGFQGTYAPGVVEGFIYRMAASANLRTSGLVIPGTISDVWVLYRETAGYSRQVVLHESWVVGPHPLERLAGAAC